MSKATPEKLKEMGIEETRAYRTPDGAVHSNQEMAVFHQLNMIKSRRQASLEILARNFASSNLGGCTYYNDEVGYAVLDEKNLPKWLEENRDALLEALK